MAALTFITDIEGVSADLVSAILVNLTDFTPQARNTLALYAYLYKRDAQLNDTQITLDNTLPLTVSQWTFSLPTPDGDFVAVIFGFNIWQARTYTAQQCVFYSVNGNYYIANTSTSSIPGADGTWTVITDIIGTVTGNPDVQQGTTHNWSDARASSGPLGDALADLAPNIRDGKCKNWEDAGGVIFWAAALESCYANFRRAQYVDAQSSIDYIDAQTTFSN